MPGISSTRHQSLGVPVDAVKSPLGYRQIKKRFDPGPGEYFLRDRAKVNSQDFVVRGILGRYSCPTRRNASPTTKPRLGAAGFCFQLPAGSATDEFQAVSPGSIHGNRLRAQVPYIPFLNLSIATMMSCLERADDMVHVDHFSRNPAEKLTRSGGWPYSEARVQLGATLSAPIGLDPS
jgi:hypothetical protein